MKHKPYPKYKPSGIDWIGDIPEGWFKKRIKYISKVNSDALPEDTDEIFEFYYIDIGNVTLENGFSRGEKITFSEAPSRARRIAKEGDTIVSTVRTYLKAIAYIDDSESELIASTGFAVVRPEDEIDRKYLYYSLCSERVVHTISAISVGVSYPAINASDLACIFLIFPNKAEQKKIAAFLDHKTAQIDDLIQKKEEMIKLLKEKRAAIINQAVTKGLDPSAKMKPSGIDWIGDIPEEWEIRRLKFLSKIISKGTTPTTIGREILSDGNIRFLKAENIQEGEIQKYPEFFIDEETNKLLKRSELKEEDILFVIAGATIGKAGLLKKEFLPANTNQAVSFVRLVKGVNKKFVLYWLQSVYIKRLTWLNAVQSAQPNLSMESLGDFAIPYPDTKDEQQQITNYLNEKTERMDSLIQKIESAIAKLREYRSSLITAAVTGKIDVRG